MSLRTLLVAAALSGAAIAQAYAADQSVPSGLGSPSYYPNAYYPTSIRWTGFYAGLNLGGAWSSAQTNNPFSGLSDSPQGGFVLGGAQIGANWQWDSLVFGVEADFDWTGLQGSATDAKGYVDTVKANWLSTITGRVGYAFNQILVYGKGGIAFTNETNSFRIPPGVYTPPGVAPAPPSSLCVNATTCAAAGILPDPSGSVVSTQSIAIGWTIGTGFEYAFDPHWSARFEYDFVDFPSHGFGMGGSSTTSTTYTFNGTLKNFCCTVFPFHNDGSTDLSVQKVVAGINYRF